MTDDLSRFHYPVTNLFPRVDGAQVSQHRLTKDQVEFFHTNGYLPRVRLLNDTQIEALRAELALLTNPSHSGRELFYEYNTNESSDPATVLFHALGAWRVAPGFHDLLASGLSCSCSTVIRKARSLLARSDFLKAVLPRRHCRVASGLFLLDVNAADATSSVGSASTTQLVKTAVCTTSREVNVGTSCR